MSAAPSPDRVAALVARRRATAYAASMGAGAACWAVVAVGVRSAVRRWRAVGP